MPGRPTNEPSNYWAFGFQSAKDVEATTFQFLRHLSGTGNDVSEQVESVREGGDGQEVGLRYKTAISMNGQAVLNNRPEVGARLMAACLGADLITAAVNASTPLSGLATVASGVANEHVAVPTSKIPYLTIEQYWADVVERAPNCQITQVDLEWEAGRPLKLTPQFIAGGTPYLRDAASALTPTRETSPPFFYPGASVVLTGGPTQWAGAKITKGKVSIKRSVDDAIRTTGLNPEDVVALAFDTDIDLTIKYEDLNQSQYKLQNYGVGSNIPIDLSTGALRITSFLSSTGTQTRSFEVGVNQFHFTDNRVNKLDGDGKTMYADVAGMGYKGATYQVYSKTLIASAAAIV